MTNDYRDMVRLKLSNVAKNRKLTWSKSDTVLFIPYSGRLKNVVKEWIL